MTDEPQRPDEQDEDEPLAGTSPTEEEQEELQSGGNSADVVKSKETDGPAKTPGA